MAAADSGGSGFYRMVIPANTTVLRANTTSDSGAGAAADTAANSVAANTWIHAAAVYSSTTLRTVYISTSTAVSATASVAAPTVNNFTLGAGWQTPAGVGLFFDGLLAEAGVWRAALTADEITSLARGVSPSLVRPQSLAFYAPLIRSLTDVRGGASVTNSGGATVANHPRIYA
jgi:hypothetical protein